MGGTRPYIVDEFGRLPARVARQDLDEDLERVRVVRRLERRADDVFVDAVGVHVDALERDRHILARLGAREQPLGERLKLEEEVQQRKNLRRSRRCSTFLCKCRRVRRRRARTVAGVGLPRCP